MLDLSYSRCAGLRGPFRTGLLFLFHLAWKSRLRLPFLIAIGFMVLDLRMQLVIDFDLGRAGRQGVPVFGQGNNLQANPNDYESDSDVTMEVEDEDTTDDSYTTDTRSLNSESTIDSNEDLDISEENRYIAGVTDNVNTNREYSSRR